MATKKHAPIKSGKAAKPAAKKVVKPVKPASPAGRDADLYDFLCRLAPSALIKT